jgi:hypothetical protein
MKIEKYQEIREPAQLPTFSFSFLLFFFFFIVISCWSENGMKRALALLAKKEN